MDSGSDAEETPFCFDDSGGNGNSAFNYDTSVSEIHKAAAKGDLVEVRRCVESGESVNKREPCYKFTLLHVAAIYDSTEVLDYLLAIENIEVDATCWNNRTPLHLATEMGNIQSVDKLIQAGSDVNFSDDDDETALHKSVPYPDICRLLIQHGARFRTIDKESQTLHDAVQHRCIEMVHMLLYYNVDANAIDEHGRTPFMLALVRGNVEAQEVLLEYVDDFNRISYGNTWFKSVLCFALQSNSPFIKDVIERGTDEEHHDEDSRFTDKNFAFSLCLYHPVDLPVFKMVWERLRCSDTKYIVNLLDLFKYTHTAPPFLQVIIDSDNFTLAVQFFSEAENYFLFVDKFVEAKFDLDQLTILTCRLLENGFRASSYDIHAIFCHYGYCELFRILLYMDNDFSRGWLPHMALCRLIYDIDYELKSIANRVNDIPKDAVLQLLEYSVCPRLIDALTVQYSEDECMSAILRRMPRVPSLLELARNAARKQIWQSLKVANNCQFYTAIDYLDIPITYKNILTFKRKIYRVNLKKDK